MSDLIEYQASRRSCAVWAAINLACCTAIAASRRASISRIVLSDMRQPSLGISCAHKENHIHTLKITAAVTVVLVAIFFALPYLVDEGKEPAMQRACEDRIRALSHNPATVKFGTPTIMAASDTTTQFTWTPDELQMQNGFGAMLGVKAVCVADRATLEVVELRMD